MAAGNEGRGEIRLEMQTPGHEHAGWIQALGSHQQTLTASLRLDLKLTGSL